MSSSSINHVNGSPSILCTEARNPETEHIDSLSSLSVLQLLHRNDLRVAPAIESCIPSLSRAIDATVSRIRRGGRVFYIGAGTSGRLGVLDASELPATFNVPPDLFVSLIAGGKDAIHSSHEYLEDDPYAAIRDLDQHQCGPEDVVVGLAASGRTPYVLSAMEYGRYLGSFTLGICCTYPSEMLRSGYCDEILSAVVGPECITGSTRLKAGTAQKMLLNMFSTAVMIKLGKTHGNLMVDLVVSNHKLIVRARKIIRTVVLNSHPDVPIATDDQLDALLTRCHANVKLAIVVAVTGLPVNESLRKLEDADGVLSRVISEKSPSSSLINNNNIIQQTQNSKLFLSIHAGESKTLAAISDHTGRVITNGEGPGLNDVNGFRLYDVIGAIQSAIPYPYCENDVHFSRVWVGISGLEREKDRGLIVPIIEDHFNKRNSDKSNKTSIFVSNECLLLARLIRSPSLRPKAGISVVSGATFSAYAWEAGDDGMPVKVCSFGAWGPLLADECTSFAIGRKALREVLLCRDIDTTTTTNPLLIGRSSSLCDKTMSYFEKCGKDILSADRSDICQVSKIVFEMMGDKTSSGVLDKRCNEILTETAMDISRSVKMLLSILNEKTDRSTNTTKDPEEFTQLCSFGGDLLCNEVFQRYVMNAFARIEVTFDTIDAMTDPAANGIEWLASVEQNEQRIKKKGNN